MLSDDDILRIGTFLEHDGMSDSEIDAWFEHTGTKGMKWGVRKTRKGTNVVTDAKTDINERRIYRTQHRRDKTGYPVSRSIAAAVYFGSDNYKKAANTKIKRLMNQNKRLRTGKLTKTDKWGSYTQPIATWLLGPALPIRGPSPIGLVISRAPKKLKPK